MKPRQLVLWALDAPPRPAAGGSLAGTKEVDSAGYPTIDSREPAVLRKAFGALGWREAALDAGDFRFQVESYLVGIERKCPSDLVGSFFAQSPKGLSRLQHQLLRLREVVGVPILLLDGWPVEVSPLPFSAITELLMVVQAEGITVVVGRGGSVQATVETVQTIKGWIEMRVAEQRWPTTTVGQWQHSIPGADQP